MLGRSLQNLRGGSFNTFAVEGQHARSYPAGPVRAIAPAALYCPSFGCIGEIHSPAWPPMASSGGSRYLSRSGLKAGVTEDDETGWAPIRK